METTVLMRDRNLETMAKAIFGESLVEAAYVATWAYDFEKKEIIDRLERSSFAEVRNEINQNAATVVITFCSGNTVKFTNSEWGEMTKIDIKASDVVLLGGEENV